MVEDTPWCESCTGPVFGRSDLELDLSHVAYWVWMRLPNWLAFSRVGCVLLPYAGSIAFACSCRDKNAAVVSQRCGISEVAHV